MDSMDWIQKTLRIGVPLALTVMLFAAAYAEEGTMPRLELKTGEGIESMTPVMDLELGELRPVALELDESQTPEQAAQKPPVQVQAPESPQENRQQSPKAEPAAQTVQPAQAEIPAVNPNPKAHLDGKAIKPVAYTPLPAIVIFPVMKHGNEKAFGDLPLIFAREFAQRMEQKTPETKVYHPIYSVDELRLRGLGHVYDQIMDYYKKAGRPEPTATDYLLKQLADDGRAISRIIFVEADLDMGRPNAMTGVAERINSWLTDATPKHIKYFVRSRLQVFDAENPSFPMVWGNSWTRSLKGDQFYNVTPSVFADSDSQQAFARLSRQMSREVMFVAPKEAYMAPQYDLAVQGQLVSGKQSVFPNFSELHAGNDKISDENKRAIQRILQRQNSISP